MAGYQRSTAALKTSYRRLFSLSASSRVIGFRLMV